MRYVDVCSGISAPTAAWKPLGWQALCYAEIEAAPRAVLQHHYPDVPLVGDFTQIKGDEYGPVDLLVGGTPCQSFSIAGLRGGLADERGNLALEYCRLADRSGARWLVWENVPGVLSSNGGRDFGSILGALAELGYGFAYRVLDAQHFGVPQRRRRVILVGYLGDWRRAAAVLFERHSLSGHPAPRRQKGEGITASPDGISGICSSKWAKGTGGPAGDEHYNLIAFDTYNQSATGDQFQTLCSRGDTPGGNSHLVPAVAFSIMPMNSGKDYKARETDVAQPVMAGGPVGGNQGGDYIVPCAFMENQRGELRTSDHANLTVGGGKPGQGYPAALSSSGVRRLTPRECERLQGFPETTRTVRITVCAGEKSDHARSARQSSAVQNRGQSEPVAVRVLIDFEQQAVRLLRADGLSWYASGAEPPSSSPLSMPADAFARLAAHTIISLVPVTEDGAAVSQVNTMPSTRRLSGSASVTAFGPEIDELASDADRLTSEATRLSRSTISRVGLDTPLAEQTLKIWSCCVLAAIGGFIPDEIKSASSYAIEVQVEGGFTLIPYRGRMMADGPRYKMLGNSMAVPVMSWIGQRIAKVDALTSSERAAA